MNTPELSIIVPVYQAKSFLKNCVESILNQEYQDYELLLIDDGSTDGSEMICDEYANEDHRILVFHQPNKGVSAARNLGLDHARGEYNCFFRPHTDINIMPVQDPPHIDGSRKC